MQGVNIILIFIAFIAGAVIGSWHGYTNGFRNGGISIMGRLISFFHKKGMDHFATHDMLEEIAKEENYFKAKSK